MPFLCHSPASVVSLALEAAAPARCIRPPGILILPALCFGTAGDVMRGFGSPSCLRSRFVSVRSGGGGVGSGEDSDDIDDSELRDNGEPGTDSVRGGVSSDSSSPSMPRGDRVSVRNASCDGRDALLCRFAIDWELSDDADDSSNVRFGERYMREGLGGDEGSG